MDLNEFEPDFNIEEIKKIEEEIANKDIPFYDVDKFVQALDYFLDVFEIEKASFLIEKALDQHPNQYEIILRKASLLNYQNKHKEALEQLNMVENRFDVEFLLTRAQVYYWLNDFQKALLDYQDALEMDEEGVLIEEIAIEIASLYRKLNQLPKAMDVLRKSFRYYGSGFSLVNEISEIGERKKIKVQAIQLLNEIIDEDPYDHFTWYVLGNLHLFHEENDLAIKAFDYAELIEEEFVLAKIGKANAYINQGEHKPALSILEACLDHKEHQEIVHILLASVLKEEGAYELALGYLDQLLEDKSLDLAFYLKAEIYELTKDYGQALEMIDQALEINPFDWNYFYLKAQILIALDPDDVVEITECFEQSLFVGGEVEVYQEYAEFLSENKNYTKSIEIISNGISNFGADKWAYRKVKYLYLSGDVDAAQEAADALELDAEQIVKLLGELPAMVLNDKVFIERLKQKIKMQ